ncbi:hypothetical protein B7494_g548 [Chlorociboria aeruginascens]|nr:hypothetical protein B7494_g548 [Chlorociboria aeruginascens]
MDGSSPSPEAEGTTNKSQPNSPSPPRDRDPACDQCRIRKVRCNRQHPKCSNCKKAKVQCGFTNKGKRVNQTKQLISDFEQLGKRLDRIELTMTKCVDRIERSTKSEPRPSSDLLPLSSEGDDASMSICSPENGERNHTEYHHSIGKNGYERFYCSSSMYSLFAEAKGASERLLNPNSRGGSPSGSAETNNVSLNLLALHDASFPHKLQRVCDLLDKVGTNTHGDLSGDGLALSLPPRSILETFVQPYLANINPTLPMFHKSSLLAAIENQYDHQRSHPDPALIVCFNNIILQTLNIKSGFDFKCRNSAPGTMDDDLMASFLVNARRGFDNFERLLKPRLVNVQALLSMALVAITHFSYATFEIVFSQACQLAKAIGLHQQGHARNDTSPAAIERRNLFWALFIVDKQSLFICNKSSHLPFFDCDAALPLAPVPDYPLHDHFLANIQISCILEEIYRNLYSAEAYRLTEAQHQQRVELLLERLKAWETTHYNVIFNPINSTSTCQKPYFALELKYSVLVAGLLVRRRSKSKTHKQQGLEDDRECLNIIKTLSEARTTIGSFIVLERIFLYYPLVGFIDLYLNLLDDFSNESSRDADLMNGVVEALSFHQARRYPDSYSGKLKIATTIMTGVAMAIRGAQESANAETVTFVSPPRILDSLAGFEYPTAPQQQASTTPTNVSTISAPSSFIFDIQNPIRDENNTLFRNPLTAPAPTMSLGMSYDSSYFPEGNFSTGSRSSASRTDSISTGPSTSPRCYSNNIDQINFGLNTAYSQNSSSTSLNSYQQPRSLAPMKNTAQFEVPVDDMDLSVFVTGLGEMNSIWGNEDDGQNFDMGMNE